MKDTTVILKLTKQEKIQLKEKAQTKHLSLSSYLRTKIFN